MALTLLAQAQLPLKYWWDACVSSVFLINRLPTSVLGHMSPFEKLFHEKSDYYFLKVFGCACYPYLKPYNAHKFQFISSKCVFLGYNPAHKGYRCLSSTGRVYVACSVAFNEFEFPYTNLFSPHPSPVSFLTPISILVSFPCNSPSSIPSLHQSVFVPNSPPESSPFIYPAPIPTLSQPISLPLASPSPSPTPQPTLPMVTRSKASIFKPKLFTVELPCVIAIEPTNVQDALTSVHWKATMDAEFRALLHNNTWELVPFTLDMNIMTNKWVFCVKYKADGNLDKYKALLIAKGFQQTTGVDFFKTFSPIIKPSTI